MKNKNSTENGECDTTGNMLPRNVVRDLNDITRGKTSGVYKIVNRVNGKYYVGSSNHILKRWTRHKNDLDNNKHRNIHLQRAWNKYGENNFHFCIVELCSESELLVLEKKHLGNGVCPHRVYNMESDPMRPSHSEETRRKMSKSLMGHGCSEITRRKMGRSRMGRNNVNYKPTIYSFFHLSTSEAFMGTMYEWRMKFNIPIPNACMLTNGQLKTSRGWRLLQISV